jgi:DNA-binding LacI/PurR family transcriptional regulator
MSPGALGTPPHGLFSGPLKIPNAKERWRGFRDALEEKKLPYEPELVVEGDYRIESGFRAGRGMLCSRTGLMESMAPIIL